MSKDIVQKIMYMENDDLEHVAQILQQDGVILYPTDTIWGLGCNAQSDRAINKLISIKGRATEKGFVVLVDSLEMLKCYVQEVSPKIETLLSHHTRPLTVIYPNPINLSPLVCALDGSVAIRVVKDEFCQELIWASGVPLISTSANISGKPFPANFGEISSEILRAADYVVKYRQNDRTKAEPSIIVKVTEKKELEFIRK